MLRAGGNAISSQNQFMTSDLEPAPAVHAARGSQGFHRNNACHRSNPVVQAPVTWYQTWPSWYPSAMRWAPPAHNHRRPALPAGSPAAQPTPAASGGTRHPRKSAATRRPPATDGSIVCVTLCQDHCQKSCNKQQPATGLRSPCGRPTSSSSSFQTRTRLKGTPSALSTCTTAASSPFSMAGTS